MTATAAGAAEQRRPAVAPRTTPLAYPRADAPVGGCCAAIGEKALDRTRSASLEELIRSLADGSSQGQPETVVAMLQARMGRMTTGARRAIRAAAVFGQTFWRGGIAALLGAASSRGEVEAWLTALAEAELVQPHAQSFVSDDQEYTFRHALVRDAAYALLTPSDVATGHLRAGEFLEGAGAIDAATIAEHFERGGDKPRAARHYLRAAQESLVRGDHLGAIRLVERGLSCSEAASGVVGELRSIEGMAAYLLNRTDRMPEASAAALRELRQGSLGWCRAMIPAVQSSINQQQPARTRELITLLLTSAIDREAIPVYVEALATVHTLLNFSAPTALMVALCNRLAAVVGDVAAESPALQRYLSYSLAVMAANREPHPFRALKEYESSLRWFEQLGETKYAWVVRAFSIEIVWLELGDREGAEQRMLAIAESMRSYPDSLVVLLWQFVLARILCESAAEAAWSRAEELAASISQHAAGSVALPIVARGIKARVALLRGQYQESLDHARVVMQSFPVLPFLVMRTTAVGVRALIGLAQPDDAVALAQQVLGAIPAPGGYGVYEVELRLAASEAWHAARNYDRAHAELRETLRQIALRANDITDPFWRDSYLTRNHYCARAQQLAAEWGLDPDHDKSGAGSVGR